MAVFQRFIREVLRHDELIPGEIGCGDMFVEAHCAYCCVRLVVEANSTSANYLYRFGACDHCAKVRMNPNPESLLGHHPKGRKAYFVFRCHRCKCPSKYDVNLGAQAAGSKFLWFCDDCAAEMVQMCAGSNSSQATPHGGTGRRCCITWMMRMRMLTLSCVQDLRHHLLHPHHQLQRDLYVLQLQCQ
jgi:hypothetical protein